MKGWYSANRSLVLDSLIIMWRDIARSITIGLFFIVFIHAVLFIVKTCIVSPPLDDSFLTTQQHGKGDKNAVAVITGGCSGIGLETGVQLYKALHMDIVLGCRNVEVAMAICYHINDNNNNNNNNSDSNNVHKNKCYAPGPLDLSSFRSVREFASLITHLPGKIPTVLVLNAGIRHNSFNLTEDGIESHYQINHLSHFLLVNLLLPTMNTGTAEEIRIIHVSSSAHYYGVIDRKVYGENVDINIHEKEISPFIEHKLQVIKRRKCLSDDDSSNYDGAYKGDCGSDIDSIKSISRGNDLFSEIQNKRLEGVYGDTKLMQVLFSDELQRRFDSNLNNKPNRPVEGEESGVRALIKDRRFKSMSVHPGFVNSNMGHEDTRWMQILLVLLRPFLGRNLFEGSLGVLYAVASPDMKGGEYINNCKVTPALSRNNMDVMKSDTLPAGSEPDIGRFLWDMSAKLCGLSATLEYDEES